ncbi:MAG: helix-turn-helix transcriptional regulator [Gammaproteobacteria bacterium]
MSTVRSEPTPLAPVPSIDPGHEAEAAMLARIGARVRETRAGRGMTRKLLATHSQISERYLAQLEAGLANPSIVVLSKLAEALGMDIADLLEARRPEAIEIGLITQLLKRAPAGTLDAIRTRLTQELGRDGDARRGRIALVGLRGAGKTTLGTRLARELGVPFVELDGEIERSAGISLSEIFLLHGQAGFRRHERRCLEAIIDAHPRCVIATGGSLVTEAATLDLLLSNCLTVWLKAAPEEHMARVVAQGDTRPMAGNQEAMDDLKRILDARGALYAQADRVVDTAGQDPEESYASLQRAVANPR